MRETFKCALALAAAAALLTGCGDGDASGLESTTARAPATSESSPSSPPTSATPTITSAPPTSPIATPTPTLTDAGSVINAGPSEFGDVLFDENGQAIYLFDVETTAVPECYDQCAIEWPPVLTDGTPVAGPSISADALGVTTRTDGSTQVTYGGHPLYTYAHEGPNEVLCHDFFEFGGTWFAVAPTGQPAPS